MAENGLERTTKVNKPAGYLKVPTPEPVAATPEPPPAGKSPTKDTTWFKPTEATEKDCTDLVNAAEIVFRALMERIAYHEREADRLRKALAPFAAAAGIPQAPDLEFHSRDDLTAAVMAAAERITGGQPR